MLFDYAVRGTQLIEVLSNDGKKVKLRITSEMPDWRGVPQKMSMEQEVDLSKPLGETLEEQADELRKSGAKVEISKTREKLRLADREFACVVTSMTATGSGDDGTTITTVGKEWSSRDVPVAWLVKSEMTTTISDKMETGTMVQTQTLAAFGSAK